MNHCYCVTTCCIHKPQQSVVQYRRHSTRIMLQKHTVLEGKTPTRVYSRAGRYRQATDERPRASAREHERLATGKWMSPAPASRYVQYSCHRITTASVLVIVANLHDTLWTKRVHTAAAQRRPHRHRDCTTTERVLCVCRVSRQQRPLHWFLLVTYWWIFVTIVTTFSLGLTPNFFRIQWKIEQNSEWERKVFDPFPNL